MGALDWLGNVKAPTRDIAEEVLAHLDSRGLSLPIYKDVVPGVDSQVIWGYNAGGAEHGTGRALDFMVMAPGPVGEAIVDYIWANRKRFGLIHIIWKKRIKSTRVNPGAWRYLGDRGTPTENHMDHPHCYFDGRSIGGSPNLGSDAGEEWKPTGKKTVRQIQNLLGLKSDGKYGVATTAAVKDIQQELGLTADGLWGPTTEEAVVSLSEKVDGIWKDLKVVKTEVKRALKWGGKQQLTAATAEAIGWGSRPKAEQRMTVGGLLQTTMRLSAENAQGIEHTREEIAALADQVEADVEADESE